MSRSLDQLIDKTDPGFELIRQWAATATNDVLILPPEPDRAAKTLLALQVTTRSTLGAVAYETGGIVVDGGWLRILGGGSSGLRRDLSTWNHIGGSGPERLPGALLIADDVVGGFFALNGGGLGEDRGSVYYLQPEHQWLDTHLTYTDWLHWAMFGDLEEYWRDVRWDGWRTEVANVDADSALSIYPPLGFEKTPIGERSRAVVPIVETLEIAIQLERELRDLPDGAKVVIRVIEDES